MEGKPYRGCQEPEVANSQSVGGPSSFYHVEWVEGVPAVVPIEKADWDIVDSLDVLFIHVL